MLFFDEKRKKIAVVCINFFWHVGMFVRKKVCVLLRKSGKKDSRDQR